MSDVDRAESTPGWTDFLDERWLTDRLDRASAGGQWDDATDLHQRLDELCRDLRKRPTSAAVDATIAFLRTDPTFLFSGYAKTRLFRAASWAPKAPAQLAWFQAFVLRRCRERTKLNDMRGVRRLARSVATPELVEELAAIRPSTDPRQRAAEDRFIRSVADAATRATPSTVVEPSARA